jgi:hypothetical protein
MNSSCLVLTQVFPSLYGLGGFEVSSNLFFYFILSFHQCLKSKALFT